MFESDHPSEIQDHPYGSAEGAAGEAGEAGHESLGKKAGGVAGFFDSMFGMAEGALATATKGGRLEEAEHWLHHNTPNLMPRLGTGLGIAGMAADGKELYDSVGEYREGHTRAGLTGGLEAASGLAGGAATTIGATGLASAGTAAALPWVAGVGGAFATGMKAGDWAYDKTEETSKGRFGTDQDGHQRTASDAAADDGIAAEGYFDGLFGAKKGSGTFGDYAANGIGAGVAMGNGVANVVGNAGHGLVDGASRLFHGLFDDDTTHDENNPSPQSKVQH